MELKAFVRRFRRQWQRKLLDAGAMALRAT
jgi:hypothetical protein